MMQPATSNPPTRPDAEDGAVLDLIVAEIPTLRRYARFLCRSADRADDLVQTCLARAIDKIASFEPGSNLRAWLFTILRHLFINDVRKGQTERNWAADAAEGARQPVVHEPQTNRMILNEIAQALLALPDEQRELILLVAIEGMTYEAAATLQDVPVGTVRSRLCRARQSLSAMIEGQAIRPRTRPRLRGGGGSAARLRAALRAAGRERRQAAGDTPEQHSPAF